MLMTSDLGAPPTLIRHACVVDPETGSIDEDLDILVVDGVIQEVGRGAKSAHPDLEVLDAHGRNVFPGLIDAHVHVTAVTGDLQASAALPKSYVTAGAAAELQYMAARGFTTVRDVGGADWGLAQAASDGLLGPASRLVFGGRALSQTGGHGDMRGRDGGADLCCSIGEVCDGPDEVRRAVRQRVASGAGHIKLMLGGGLSSELDRLDGNQFAEDEIGLAVAEADAGGIYVTGHAYTPEAISRAVRLGVACIEHGNLLDAPTATLMAEHDVVLAPTLVTYEELSDFVESGAAPRHYEEKLKLVRTGGLRAIELAVEHGVEIAFGTDLLGPGRIRQLDEFTLRREVQSPLALLRSATTVGARLLRHEGRLGVVQPGAYADLIVSELDPTQEYLDGLRSRPYVVMAGGMFIDADVGHVLSACATATDRSTVRASRRSPVTPAAPRSRHLPSS